MQQKKKRTNTIPKILVYLAINRGKNNQGKNKWQIKEALKKSYSNVFQTIPKLLAENLIRVSDKLPGDKNPKIEVEYYELTHSGLLAALQALEETGSWKHIDTIADNYKEMEPLLFGKWSFFEKKGIRNLIVQRLRAAIKAFSLRQNKTWYKIQEGPSEEAIEILVEAKGKEVAERALWRHSQIVENLTNSVLGFNRYLHPKSEDQQAMVEEEKRILQILSEDQDIKEYLRKQIKFWKETYSSTWNNVQGWEEWFNTL
jgi:hypothetical protein